MKLVKKFIICLWMLGFCFGCSEEKSSEFFSDSNASPPLDEAIIVDPSLVMGEGAEVLNEKIAGRALAIVHSPTEAKVLVVLDRVIVDPFDSAGLQAFLSKYGAQVLDDPDIPLSPLRILDLTGVTEAGSTQKVVSLDLSYSNPNEYAALAERENLPIPVYVSSEEAKDYLNLLARFANEDSKKIGEIRMIVYSLELPDRSVKALDGKGLVLPEWAQCKCIDENLGLRLGATWFDEVKEAPVYNALIADRESDTFCGFTPNNSEIGNRNFTLQGENVLLLDFATIYDNRAGGVDGAEGNMHLWAFPTKALPLSLSGQLDQKVPVGANDLFLRGPLDHNLCEWADGSREQYLAYQNYILWEWDRSDPAGQVGILIWEGDECFLRFFCNDDDLVVQFIVDREETLHPQKLLLRDIDESKTGLTIKDLHSGRGVDLKVRTIDFCRNNGPEPQEICNGYDDTCDGLVDEDFPDKGMPCNNGGTGQCLSRGVFICSSPAAQKEGADPLVCNAVTYEPGSFEICDGIDNDCDGQVDEDWLQMGWACGLGVGTCGVGAMACSSGQIQCEGEIAPIAEICGDGLDNDCDGVTDEGCPCPLGTNRECSINLGPCSKGIQECEAGGIWSAVCSGIVPEPEICDGIDNNCNSSVDEGVLNRCGSCGPEPLEVCDGLDNDCDSQVDEGVTNSCGGCWAEGPEICDGIDNDCDGVIDDLDAPQSCGTGVCEVTIDSVCETCTPTLPPTDREREGRFPGAICGNGLDDDCDGYTDGNDPDCWDIGGGGG